MRLRICIMNLCKSLIFILAITLRYKVSASLPFTYGLSCCKGLSCCYGLADKCSFLLCVCTQCGWFRRKKKVEIQRTSGSTIQLDPKGDKEEEEDNDL